MTRKFRSLFKRAGVLLGLTLVLTVMPVPSIFAQTPAPTANAVATVTAFRAEVWAGPGRGFWFLSAALRGSQFPVMGVTADKQFWQTNVQISGQTVVGYLRALDVNVANGESVPVIDPGPIGVVTTGIAVLHTEAGITAPVAGHTSRGQEFFVIGQRPDGSWLNIRWRFGKAWISASLVTTSGATNVPNLTGVPRAIANTGALNIRTGPGIIFKSLGTVHGGTVLPIIGRTKDGIWLNVKSTFGDGWVNANFVITKDYFGSAPITTAMAATAQTEADFKALGGSVNVRSGPGTSFPVQFTADAGEVFTILGQSNLGWWYVQGRQGKGWVNKSLGQATGDVAGVPFMQ